MSLEGDLQHLKLSIQISKIANFINKYGKQKTHYGIYILFNKLNRTPLVEEAI